MPSYIIKLKKGRKARYMMWSTIVDAPISRGYTLENFKRWYNEREGGLDPSGIASLDSRLARVEEKGLSAKDYDNLDQLISFNRAGPNESCLTRDELWALYCLENP